MQAYKHKNGWAYLRKIVTVLAVRDVVIVVDAVSVLSVLNVVDVENVVDVFIVNFLLTN